MQFFGQSLVIVKDIFAAINEIRVGVFRCPFFPSISENSDAKSTAYFCFLSSLPAFFFVAGASWDNIENLERESIRNPQQRLEKHTVIGKIHAT